MPTLAHDRVLAPALLALGALALVADQALAQGCPDTADVVHLGGGSSGYAGAPRLAMIGSPITGRPLVLTVDGARPGALCVFAASGSGAPVPLAPFSATQHVLPPFAVFNTRVIGPTGAATGPGLALAASDPALCGATLFAQALVVDPDAVGGLAFTAGLALTFGAASDAPLLPGPFVDVDGELSDARAFDLDGDGVMDLVGLAGGATPAIVVARGTGQQDFAPAVRYPVGEDPSELVVADFDGDGQADVATCSRATDSVHVFLGAGAGLLVASTVVAVPAEPTSLEHGDFDGDGAVDLAVLGRDAEEVAILRNLGGATFAAVQTLPLEGQGGRVRAADLDGDGVLDLAAVHWSQTTGLVRLWRGVGDGTFANPKTLATGERCVSLAIGDATGDGIPDLVAGHGLGARFTLLRGVGNMSFAVGQFIDCGVDASDLALADVDGDGLVDVVAADDLDSSATERVQLVTSSGGGSFDAPRPVAPSQGGATLDVVDVDGDGVLDLVGATFLGDGITVSNGDGVGGFTRGVRIIELSDAIRDAATADFDGDGYFDLALVHASGDRITVLRGGSDLDALATVETFLTGLDVRMVAAGDVDGNGVADLVAVTFGTDVEMRTLAGVGDATFVLAGTRWLPPFTPVGLDLIDVDGDLDLDAVYADYRFFPPSRIATLINPGDGRFDPAVLFNTGISMRCFDTGDLDGDGRVDLVAYGPGGGQGTIRRYASVGDGTYLAGTLLATAVPGIPEFRESVAVGRFDGDDDLDVVVAGGDSATFAVLSGDGNGGFGPPVVRMAGGSPTNVLLADLDGDAADDVVFLDVEGGRATALTSVTNFAPDESETLAVPATSLGHAVVDLDGDGAPEVVVWGGDAGVALHLFENQRYE